MKRKIKQEDLAALLGITRTSLVNIEKGRQHPNLYLIFEIAYHLDIDHQKLLPTKEGFINDYIGTKPAEYIRLTSITQIINSDKDPSESLEKFFNKAINIKANETGDNKG